MLMKWLPVGTKKLAGEEFFLLAELFFLVAEEILILGHLECNGMTPATFDDKLDF